MSDFSTSGIREGDIETPRQMFEAHFDDLKRKMAPKGVELHKIITCFRGTAEYNTWMELFVMPENDTIHYTSDEKDDVYTFYTILNTKKESANNA